MVPLLHHGLLLLTLSSLCGHCLSVSMEKLANNKLCADVECSCPCWNKVVFPVCSVKGNFESMSFINIKRGQMIYVYSKLLPEEGAGVFWSGSVYSDRYVDQMGLIGYFPSNLVTEMQVYKEGTLKIPTTKMDFKCD